MNESFYTEYESSFSKAINCLEEGFEYSIQFYAFRINNQWRIKFKLFNNEAYEVILWIITRVEVYLWIKDLNYQL